VIDKNKLIELYEKHKDKPNKWRVIGKELNEDHERVRDKYRALRKSGEVATENDTKGMFELKQFASVIKSDVLSKSSVINIGYKKPFTGKIKESAVLMLSDIHEGKINKFSDFSTSGKSSVTYNHEIMLTEFNKLTESIYSVIGLLKGSYDIEKLYIYGLGDYLDNDVIYKGQRFFVEYGAGKQILMLVKVLSDFVRELLKVFKEIEFVGISGNHGRFTANREEAPVENNIDYLMLKFLEIMFKDEKRVKFIIPESWFHLHQIYDWKYFLHHGDTVYSWLSLPYYGIVRQGKARRIEVDYDIDCIGHFHTRMEIPVSSTAYTLVNGSFVKKDSFAWKKFGVISKAEQYFFGVSPKRPRTWSFSLEM
jgi:hypothetical protein